MKGSKGIAILDTNVASYMLKGLPLGAEYTALTLGYDLRLSFVTTASYASGRTEIGWGRSDGCTWISF